MTAIISLFASLVDSQGVILTLTTTVLPSVPPELTPSTRHASSNSDSRQLMKWANEHFTQQSLLPNICSTTTSPASVHLPAVTGSQIFKISSVYTGTTQVKKTWCVICSFKAQPRLSSSMYRLQANAPPHLYESGSVLTMTTLLDWRHFAPELLCSSDTSLGTQLSGTFPSTEHMGSRINNHRCKHGNELAIPRCITPQVTEVVRQLTGAYPNALMVYPRTRYIADVYSIISQANASFSLAKTIPFRSTATTRMCSMETTRRVSFRALVLESLIKTSILGSIVDLAAHEDRALAPDAKSDVFLFQTYLEIDSCMRYGQVVATNVDVDPSLPGLDSYLEVYATTWYMYILSRTVLGRYRVLVEGGLRMECILHSEMMTMEGRQDNRMAAYPREWVQGDGCDVRTGMAGGSSVGGNDGGLLHLSGVVGFQFQITSIPDLDAAQALEKSVHMGGSSNSVNLRTNSPEVSHLEDSALSVAAKHWFKSLSDAIEAKDSTTITAHFLADGYWRDLLSLSWDNRTLHTIPVIKNFLDDNDRLKSSGLRNFKLEGEPVLLRANRDFTWVQCFFTFETSIARGRGFFRLMRGADDGAWKAKTFYTGIEEFKGYEEHRGSTRPVGVNHGANTDRKSWKDSRTEKREFIDAEPTVLIIGAGQSGLVVGTRLGQLNVNTLLIDKNDRVGDNWRKRYNFLVLHDPVWYDHLPYVTFPPHWPVFTPKDKLGDWFEAYAVTMELNIWMQSTITSATYDEPSHLWTVTIARVGHPNRIIKPKFIVLATGHSGEPNIPVFKDQDIFKGHLCHSSQHTTGGSFKGKKAVVVGCCNSGHE
ncbi:uncharacterized protein EV420DRAFT_1745222 [Desarmillaria tabescens]|uniref:FAD/NAD(P)-binding domain-containing protein n=1 Tax=Armillaria tabescens TaxID=1929756 RepID=A0AA39NDU0_ARMTA|nr:uncharacterized protein EV420DRAFT_1745222 [Desarmillaria tabescens]KAK0463684.1 hypothetical protein EV420DRAFT_1745222 [Desarmillaria tabescens]